MSTMVGFDPTALGILLARWKLRRTDPDPVIAEQWRLARHELSLVIAVSPFREEAPKSPQAVSAVDPSGGEQERPTAREKTSSLFAEIE